MDELRSSTIHRNLDSKIKIMGMEVHDLILILIFAATMNLIFGRTGFAFVFVILIPAILGSTLYLIKRNKPDGFLIDYFRYHLSPGWYAAGSQNKDQETRPRRIYL
ncbi:MAG: hypothetical protein JWQ35_313 [Bacteriovoracaceae bacterium]|nr:hypothetical protein [Bacteriovoracaceae bacterium]